MNTPTEVYSVSVLTLQSLMNDLRKKIITGWLIIGLVMIYVQVLLGGITRLTGSGLSITEWNVIMGAIPPLHEAQWQEMFDKYKQFPQYKKMNADMDLAGFKSIFWWEYVHRLWARAFGAVFIIGFFYFLYKKWINKKFAINLVILFCFGLLEALAGIIMVQSGLKDNPWVNPLKLGIHLMLALFTYSFLLWLIISFADGGKNVSRSKGLKKWLNYLIVLIFIQIFFGALMAGHKAAIAYPTWPTMNGEWIPSYMITYHPAWVNIFENVTLIQFVHRGIAYILATLLIIFWFAKRKSASGTLLKTVFNLVPLIVLVQVLLGIMTLINSLGQIPVVWAELHQAVAIILLTSLLYLRFTIAKAE
jgi:heme a synthase